MLIETCALLRRNRVEVVVGLAPVLLLGLLFTYGAFHPIGMEEGWNEIVAAGDIMMLMGAVVTDMLALLLLSELARIAIILAWRNRRWPSAPGTSS